MPVSMEDIERIYVEFRKAQSFSLDRGWRMPKNFEDHFERMNGLNRKALIKITGFFLTKWQNVNPYQYFLCGFELYSTFTYRMFFNEKILRLYIEKDKNKKRQIKITKVGIAKSALFVKNWMRENNASFGDYMRARNGTQRVAIEHYLENNIDAAFLVFMIRKGMILNDHDRSMVPYIQERYRKINFGLNDIKDFLVKLEGKL
jgi:hypothetical protein